MRGIFDFIKNFVDHLDATSSILLAIGFAIVMYLLQLGANKGQQQQAKTQLHLEHIERILEEIIRSKNGSIPEYFVEQYPFNVLSVCKRLKRQDLITSDLRWQLLKTGTLTAIFLVCYFAIFGFVIVAIMKALGKIE